MRSIALIILLTLNYLAANKLSAQNMKLKITIENKEFTATLNDSEATQELVKLLPMTVTMNELNGNEKYYDLPSKMPGRATNPGHANTGDLMIWSSRTLVLFYSGVSTSYSYIRLGKIDNTSKLQEAVGRGNIKITYELEKQNKGKDKE